MRIWELYYFQEDNLRIFYAKVQSQSDDQEIEMGKEREREREGELKEKW